MNNALKYFFVACAIVVLLVSCKSTKNSAKAGGSSKLSEKQLMEFTHLYHEASKQKVLGNEAEAAALYRKCNAIDPSNAAVYYELASIAYSNKDYKSSEELSRLAVTKKPENEWFQELFAESLFRNRKLVEAAKIYDKLIDAHPERIDYYYSQANAYIYADKYEQAIDTYNRLEKQFGISEEISLQKQRIYLKIDKIDKAVAEIQKLIEAYPKEKSYYNLLADLYLTNGHKEKAIETYNRILETDPGNGPVHLSLAEYYRETGDKEKSFQELVKAFNSKDVDIDSKMKILLSYYNITETADVYKDQAYQLLEIMVKNHPADAKAYSIYGDFLYRDKKLKEARSNYLKALEFDKSKFPIWYQVLIIDSELNDYVSMKKVSSEAMELFPEQAALYLLNGISNLQLGKINEAIASLNAGIPLVVDNKPLLGQFYANLGDAQHRNKDYVKSDEAYDKALAVNPDDLYVLNNYSYYLSLRKENLEKAEKMSKRTNELEPGNNSYLDTYGWILYEMGRYAEAKVWIDKAITAGGANNAVILEHYGDVLYKLNDRENALLYWSKAKAAGKGSELLEKKINEKKLIEP